MALLLLLCQSTISQLQHEKLCFLYVLMLRHLNAIKYNQYTNLKQVPKDTRQTHPSWKYIKMRLLFLIDKRMQSILIDLAFIELSN